MSRKSMASVGPTVERLEMACKAYRVLRKCSKAYLEAEVKRSHRVIDLRNASKYELAVMLVEDRFGRATVEYLADGIKAGLGK